MDKIIRLIKSPSARSTFVFYVGSFVSNIGRYFFHLLLLKLLTPNEYGEFLSYLSLIYILGIPTATISQIVVKEVAEMYGKKETDKINSFFYFINRLCTPPAVVLGAIIILFSSNLSQLFKAHQAAFVILGISLAISVVQTTISSYIIALQHFIFQTFMGFIAVILTTIFAFTFIRSGFAAGGAVAAQIVAGVIISIFTLLKIKKLILPPTKHHPALHPDFKSFVGISFLFALGSMSIISTDVLVVRALVDTHTSGMFAGLSILGRSVYFALAPLTAVALPVATHRFALTGSARSVFIKLGGAIAFFGLGVVLIFSLFPNLIIGLMSKSEYSSVAYLLPYTAFSMFLYSLSQFTLSYFMATKRAKFTIVLLMAAILQPLLIFFFHQTLDIIIYLSLFVQLLLFVCTMALLGLTKSNNH